MSTQITTNDLATWLSDQKWSSFAQSLARAHKRFGSLTERQESAARSMHTKCIARSAAREAAKSVPAPEVGFYCTGSGEFYRVQSNKAETNVYAKQLIVVDTTAGQKPYWKYVGRMPFANLGQDARLTTEQAAEFGHAHGHCLICTRELSDEDSLARGIGPVCAEKWLTY